MSGSPTGAGGTGGGGGVDPRGLDDDITRRFADAARKLTGERRTGEPAPPARPLVGPLGAPPVASPVVPSSPAAEPDRSQPGAPLSSTSGPGGGAPDTAAPAAGAQETDRTVELTARLPRPVAAAVPPTSEARDARRSGSEPLTAAGVAGAGRAGRAGPGAGAAARTEARHGAGSATSVSRGPRRARLVVRRVDPWSVFKLAFLYSSCLLVVLVVAVGTLRAVLESMGVFDAVSSTVQEVVDTGGTLDRAFATSTVLSVTAVIGAVNVVIVTAFATLGAVLYNLCSDLVGGIEVTLADRD